MPSAAPRPCAHAGCAALVPHGQRWCDEHKAPALAEQDARRGSARERGYSARWEHVRKHYLTDHPLCELCEAEGRVKLAALVHHRTPIEQGGRVLDRSNLEALCVACHGVRHRHPTQAGA